MLLSRFVNEDIEQVVGHNCKTEFSYASNTSSYSVAIKKSEHSTVSAFELRGTNQIYINYLSYYILVGITDDEFIFIRNGTELVAMKKDRIEFRTLEEINFNEFYGTKPGDEVISLEEEGDKYSINIKWGKSIDSPIYKDYPNRTKTYTLRTKLDIRYKALAQVYVNQSVNVLSTIEIPIYTEDIGMKIDTTLDKEPIYFCDGTKDRFIITEDMIVRGNTNFDNDEITINDKRIITEDNLKG